MSATQITDSECMFFMDLSDEEWDALPRKVQQRIRALYANTLAAPQQTHTPTPWKVEGDCIWADHPGRMSLICDMRGQGRVPGDAATNAAHIVHCVNVHDELLEALKLAQEFIRVVPQEVLDMLEDAFPHEQVWQAIAKAEGRR